MSDEQHVLKLTNKVITVPVDNVMEAFQKVTDILATLTANERNRVIKALSIIYEDLD